MIFCNSIQITLMKSLYHVITEKAYERSLIENAHNGHAFIGCIIMNMNCSIMSSGINVYDVDRRHLSIHAEHNAIISLNRYIGRKRNSRKGRHSTRRIKVNIVVYRTNRRGDELLNARPCEKCMKLMFNDQRLYKINRVYYTDEHGIIQHL